MPMPPLPDLNAVLGRKPKYKTKRDTLAVIKYEEHLVKKDFKRLEKDWAAREAEKLKADAFQGGDEDEEHGDDNAVVAKSTVDVEYIKKLKYQQMEKDRAERRRQIAEAKERNKLSAICKEILDMIKGRQYLEHSVIVDSDKMKVSTVIDLDLDISWEDRSRACEALWAFQFKGDIYKEVVVACGGVELLVSFLERPPNVGHKDQFSLDAFCRHALVCLRSLAVLDKNVEHMVGAGVVQLMIKMVDAPENDTRVLALECLASLAQHSKGTRKFLTGPRHQFLSKLLGNKKAGGQNFHRLVKNGLEPCAIAALHLVETLLTKDNLRLFVINETFVLSVIRTVMDSKNMQSQASVCRMVMRLCQSDECRSIMQKLGVSDFAAEFFVSSYSSEMRAMACAALGSLVTSKDESLANKCLPKIWEILKTPAKYSSEEERTLMEVPGALRALRAFSKQRWVQDSVVSHDFLMNLINYIADDNAFHVTRAEAAHILGSIALQTKHHKTIMSSFIPPVGPLMMLVYKGSQVQQFSAARAIQHLTYYPNYCTMFANFKVEDAKFDKKLGKEVVHRWDAIRAVTNLCLPAQASNCRTHGAGVLRNFCSCDNIRQRIIRYLVKKVPLSPGALLIDLLKDGNTLAARTHACAALGNLASTTEYARAVCHYAGGKAVQLVANVLYAEPTMHADKIFATESKLSAITTLSLLACDDDCAKEVLDSGALVQVSPCLSSRMPANLRLAAAKCCHNISSFKSGSQAVVDSPGMLDAIIKTAKSDDIGLQEHMAATIANVAAFSHLQHHLVSSRCCSTLVYLLKRGKGASKRQAAATCKNLSRSRDPAYCRPLVEAGAISALVKLLKVEKDIEDGCAELAALALGRLGAVDAISASRLVDNQGFDGLLQLLATGCESARVTAARTLLYFSDNKEFAKLMVQVCGITYVHTAMKHRDEAYDLCGSLLTVFTENSTKSDAKMSSVDRKLAKRNAELRNRVALMREIRDNPELREKTPNVNKFLHRPRPTTAPDRRDLQSAGSNFEPDVEFDIDDDDFMNNGGIPNLIPVSASERPATSILVSRGGVTHACTDPAGTGRGSTRGSILTRGGLHSSLSPEATTAASSRRVTFDDLDDDEDDDDAESDDVDPRPKNRDRPIRPNLPKIR